MRFNQKRIKSNGFQRGKNERRNIALPVFSLTGKSCVLNRHHVSRVYGFRFDIVRLNFSFFKLSRHKKKEEKKRRERETRRKEDMGNAWKCTHCVDQLDIFDLYTLSIKWSENRTGINGLSTPEYLNAVRDLYRRTSNASILPLCQRNRLYTRGRYSLKPRPCIAKLVLLDWAKKRREVREGRPWFAKFLRSCQVLVFAVLLNSR